MVAVARPLTSTMLDAPEVELCCPGKNIGLLSGQRCGRVLAKVQVVAYPYKVSILCRRCHALTVFEVGPND